MDFSEALLECKGGKRVRNSHWPEEMFIFYLKNSWDSVPVNHEFTEAAGIPPGVEVVLRPSLMLHAVDGTFVPYVATQSDLLSEVWEFKD